MCSHSKKSSCGLAALLHASLWLLAGLAQAGHSQYQVLYQGIFSLGGEMKIADVTLSDRRPSAAYRESELQVSSQAYGHVEALYPIRYRFRSWYRDDPAAGLVSEVYEKNGGKDEKHRLVYLDDPKESFVTRNLKKEGELDLPALLEGSYRPGNTHAQRPRFDRLGLLAHVRSQSLAPGQRLSVQVSNGKKMMEYRVRVEGREQLEVAGQTWQALKLQFDGLRLDERGQERRSHRPVYIWVSDDSRHLPLRAVSRHALGRFTLKLRSFDRDRLALGSPEA